MNKGYEVVNFCEIDPYASTSYVAIHGIDPALNLGDITKVDKVNPFTAICGGSPCFAKGTLVLTDNGYKEIENISCGDRVLTHKGRYMPVLRVGKDENKEIFCLKAQGFHPIYCTEDHPFYVKKEKDSQPKKIRLNKMKPGYYVGSNIGRFKPDNIIWYPVEKIEKTDRVEDVYNIEVAEDHTYTANNVITFNCQDFSISGNQEGSKWHCNDCGHEYNPLTVDYRERERCPHCGSTNLDKTRSSLLVEWLRIIRENSPKWGIYENVKNIVGTKFKETFDMFIQELDDYGYNTYWKVLNAKDFGVPQNRERVYLILVRKDLDNGKFKFPNGFESDICLADVLDDDVDEKYYVNTPRAKELIDELIASGKLTDQYGE